MQLVDLEAYAPLHSQHHSQRKLQFGMNCDADGGTDNPQIVWNILELY
jgi:hypothetical protein